MKVIRELADRVVVLLAGEKIADGPPRDILADKARRGTTSAPLCLSFDITVR